MTPLFLEKIWGGQTVATLPDKGVPAGMNNVGETWEVADLAEGQSRVAGGPLAGKTLGAVVESHGAALLGPGRRGARRFPLLVKMVDAADRLSVQVHPGAAYAATHPGTFSKDEAWLVMATAPGAYVLHGFVEGVDKAAFEKAIANNRAETLLRRIEVAPGDVVHVAPGTVHAIGPGVTLLEVQEPSDTTFRVYDYGRRDASGQPRALHVAQALEVCRFGPQPVAVMEPTPSGRGRLLVQTDSYFMEELLLPAQVGAAAGFSLSPTSPLVAFCLEGRAAMLADDERVDLPRGRTVLLPPGGGGFTVEVLEQGTRVVLMGPDA